MKVTKTIPATTKNGLTAPLVNTVEYDFGSDLYTAVELFGEKEVFEAFIGAAVIKLQAFMASQMIEAKDKDGVITPSNVSNNYLQELCNNWKLTAGGHRLTKKDKAVSILDSMSDDEIRAFLEKRAQQ